MASSSRRGSYYHAQEQYSGRVEDMEHFDTFRAKQRASVAWIVQKAHKNKVPADLHDPYYRDYEGVEHLKPGIVHRLANADLYCSALANIYGDPNFHNLSHWNIIQALARKGVYVAEPTDVALTETVLIQVSPIKMSAHLAVIEAMMALYIREVVVAGQCRRGRPRTRRRRWCSGSAASHRHSRNASTTMHRHKSRSCPCFLVSKI